jgi:hypothetical protein
MSRRAALFTQADVTRALRAAERVAAGRMTIEIATDGVIRIIPLDASPATRAASSLHDESEDPFARGLESVP